MQIGSGTRTPLPSTEVSCAASPAGPRSRCSGGHRTCLKERLSGRTEQWWGAAYSYGGLRECPTAALHPQVPAWSTLRTTDTNGRPQPLLTRLRVGGSNWHGEVCKGSEMSLLEGGEKRMRKHNGKAMGEGIRKALPSGSGHSPRDWSILRSWEARRADITCPFLQGGGDGGSERLIALPKVTKLIKRATLNTLKKTIVFLPAIFPLFILGVVGVQNVSQKQERWAFPDCKLREVKNYLYFILLLDPKPSQCRRSTNICLSG